MLSKGVIQAFKEEKQPIVLPSYGSYEPRQPARHHNLKSAVVSCIFLW